MNIRERVKAALFGLYVADATAMPVHWMYDLSQLRRDYGKITKFVKPKDRFEGSIMNLSNTGGGGRGSDRGEIIGDVINHGKRKYWLRGGNFHYHLGLDAGENTLEAQLCRLLVRSITNSKGYDYDAFLNEYVRFMTTPGSHNDTYASTCHRMFFANYVKNLPPSQCADNDGHNTDAIDALTLVVPIILIHHNSPAEERNEAIQKIIATTRKSTLLPSYAINFSNIFLDVLKGVHVREAIDKHANKLGIKQMVEESRGDPMVACYIQSSYPALLYFAYKYADNFEAAILASANAGGENVARGSLLGSLLGAFHGMQSFPSWAYELKHGTEILREIDEFVELKHGQETVEVNASS